MVHYVKRLYNWYHLWLSGKKFEVKIISLIRSPGGFYEHRYVGGLVYINLREKRQVRIWRMQSILLFTTFDVYLDFYKTDKKNLHLKICTYLWYNCSQYNKFRVSLRGYWMQSWEKKLVFFVGVVLYLSELYLKYD